MFKTKQLPGHFITLEGGEGSGKSSLLQKISDALTARGYEVVTTREPGGSMLGNQIRQWLLESKPERPISHLAELFLFLAARAQHVDELTQPALAVGKVVICDRFNDSTLAYQGIARALDMKMVNKLCQMVCQTVQPELTLFLNVDPQVGLNRSKGVHKEESGQGTLDRIESENLDFHIKVQQAFKTIAAKEPLRVYTIDANQSRESVLKEALRAIEELVLLPHSKNG